MTIPAKARRFLILLFILGGSASLCLAQAFSLVDARGRQLNFSKAPTRIAVTGKGLFMVADALYLFPEAASRITAIGDTSQGRLSFTQTLDPDYAKKTVLDNNAGVEAILATKPDLVIFKNNIGAGIGEAVESAGVPVVYVDFETPEQYRRDLAILGAVFQDMDRAKQLIAAYDQRVDRVGKATAALAENQKPRCLVLYCGSQGGTVSFNVPPLGWMQTLQIRLAGGIPVWQDAQLGKGWTVVTIEEIAAWNPDFIFVVTYNGNPEQRVDRLKSDPRWALLKAVQNGRLFAFAADYYSFDEPDPRWVLGLEWMADKLHPELFPGFVMKSELFSFYKDMYALDEATTTRLVGPYFAGALR